MTPRMSRMTAMLWLRRVGVVLSIVAAGAIGAYAMDVLLSLFAFNTQVVIGVAVTLLLVGGVIWWASNALFEAVEEVRATGNDISEGRAEGRELLTYTRELLTLAQAQVRFTVELLRDSGLTVTSTDDTDLTADEVGRMIDEGSPVEIVTERPATEVMPTGPVTEPIPAPERETHPETAPIRATRTDTSEAATVITPQAVSGRREDETVEEWARREVAAMWDRPRPAAEADDPGLVPKGAPTRKADG